MSFVFAFYKKISLKYFYKEAKISSAQYEIESKVQENELSQHILNQTYLILQV